jgi:hypothetical protein
MLFYAIVITYLVFIATTPPAERPFAKKSSVFSVFVFLP